MIIKVCGMRDGSNIREVDALGIDLMGFIFYKKSARYVDSLPSAMPINARRVGVFVNADIDEIEDKVHHYSLHAVQLHGTESIDFIKKLKSRCPIKIIKSFPVKDHLVDVKDYEGLCDFFLFDTSCTTFGGSGISFDWKILETDLEGSNTPFLISGGIGPGMEESIRTFNHPNFAGIDLNSRFELKPAVKDVSMLNNFLNRIRINK